MTCDNTKFERANSFFLSVNKLKTECLLLNNIKKSEKDKVKILLASTNSSEDTAKLCKCINKTKASFKNWLRSIKEQ